MFPAFGASGTSRPRALALLPRMVVLTLMVSLTLPLLGTPASAAAPTEAPVLTAPTYAETVDTNPVFRWDAVPGAVKYRIEVSTSQDFATIVYSALGTPQLAATPPTELPLGNLYWRVAGLDAANAAGPYATSAFVKTFARAPTPTAPMDSATLHFPSDPALFTWEPLRGAETYEIEIDDAPDFVGATTAATDSTSYTLLNPQGAGTYYWHVRGKAGGVNSFWSETRSYKSSWPGRPELVRPADTTATSVEDVVLEWTSVLGAASYRLQISPNGDFANNVSLDVSVKGTQFSPNNKTTADSLQNGSYYWRVQAVDATGKGTAPFSQPAEGQPGYRFQRAWSDKPALLAPADSASVKVPELRWNGVDHASHYEVQLSTDPNFTVTTSPLNPSVCYTNSTRFTPYVLRTGEGGTAPVVPGACAVDPTAGTYYWRVRGIDSPASPAILGVFSDARSFTFRPDMVQLLAPESGADVAVPVLEWAPVTGFAAYRVTILNAGGTVVNTKDTFATSYTPTVLLKAAAGPFSWYVQTLDGNNKPGLIPAPASRRTFQVVDVVAEAATPEPLAASSPSAAVLPSFAWTSVTGANKYTISYGVQGADMVTVLASGHPYAAYTHPSVVVAGQYYWVVDAYADGTYLSTTINPATFVVQDLLPTGYVSPLTCLEASCAPEGETPTLRWNSVQHAGLYRVYLANDAAFTNRVRVYETRYPSLTPRESLLDSQAGEAYYWFVRPCRSSTVCSALETELDRAQAFRKRSAPVALLSPADKGQVVDLPRFSWTEYTTTGRDQSPAVWQGAKQYRLTVSALEDFSVLVDDVLVDQTEYAPQNKTYPEGPLFWRVQAIDGSNNPLTFSETRSLVKSSGKPLLLEPEALDANLPLDGQELERVPFFRWAPQPYAVKYEIETYKNGDLAFSAANKIAAGSRTTLQTAWSPTDTLGGQGTYAWRVRRLDVDGRPGSWSEGRLFHLSALEPELVAPVAGRLGAGNDLLFSWNPVQGAAKYRFQSSTSSNFASALVQQVTVMTSWAPTIAYADGVHYWRVQVLDADGKVLATSPSTAAAQAKQRVMICSPGSADTDGDGYKDSCDDLVDVPASTFAYPFIKKLVEAGVTGGCSTTGGLQYCSNGQVTRREMAIFLLRAAKISQDGSNLPPYAATFADVPDSFSAEFIEELARRQVTGGCGTDAVTSKPNFCPEPPSGSTDTTGLVTRQQMALFLLRTAGISQDGSNLPPYEGMFGDVPASYAAPFIEELARSGVTGGCAVATGDVKANYCPAQVVTRQQMAIFLVRVFDL